jgi:hypothetical protein
LLALLCLTLAGPALAQNYSFSVPSMEMELFVQRDASVRIVYDIVFENDAFASPIDIVDIGTPTGDYDLDDFTASIDGVPLSAIYTSEYIDTGVEIHLGAHEIPAGETGVLHVEFTMPDMVYEDLTREGYASLQITPTWFDGGLIHGTTDLGVAVHMLPEVDAEALLYQDQPYPQFAVYQGHPVAVWTWQDTQLTRPHEVGVSFPTTGMERVVEMSRLQLVQRWLEDNPGVRTFLGIASAVLFAVLYFRFTGGTGFVPFLLLLGGLVGITIFSPVLLLVALPALLLLVFLNERHLRTRRDVYLPAIAEVEGGGIKRGLTAPEAAVLLEQPVNQVLTLTVFGMMMKGIVRQVEPSPLTVELTEPFRTLDKGSLRTPGQRLKHRRNVARQQGTVVHAYEEPFLFLIEEHPGTPLEKLDFSGAVKGLIAQTAAKMKGFDLSDTRDYYREIVKRAYKKAESIEEIPEREQFLDKYLPWILMREGYPTVLTRPGHTYWPTWARPVHVGGGRGGRASGGGSGGRSGGGRSGSRGTGTSLGDVGASFAGWAESTMGGMAGAILPGSLSAPGGARGVINLGGVDRVTGDVFEALMTSSGSGGGGGGGCACACAGCACACACAGGGR